MRNLILRVWLPLILLFGLSVAPASSEILAGGDVQLHEGGLTPMPPAPLSNASGTLQLEEPNLSALGAGHSEGSSGIQLDVGVAPVPEPAAFGQLVAGILALTLLRRSRRFRRIPPLSEAIRPAR